MHIKNQTGIQVVRDDLEATVLRFEFELGRVQWVVFNPEGRSLEVASGETHETLADPLEAKS